MWLSMMEGRFYILLNVIVGLVLMSLAEKEFTQPVDQHYPNGIHNVEFDHDAILGSIDVNDDFSKLSAHEAKKKLSQLLKKMDTSEDGYISKTELSDWVLATFRNQDQKESMEKMKEDDANSDGQVSWAEYLKKVFGYSLEDITTFRKDTSPEMQTFLRMVQDDEDKFSLADQNKDGFLDASEHAAFLFPGDFEYMLDHEISRTLTDLDRNNDGYIDFDEYLGESRSGGAEQLIVDRENFKGYDTNDDGKLDRNEIQAWTLPHRRVLADEEAEHLIQETDMNNDERLSFDEILDRHDLWVGSAATDYGQSLHHDPSEL